MRSRSIISGIAAIGLVLSMPLTVAQAATAPASAAQYKTPAEAKSHCGSQPVVWANTSSRVLHTPTSKYYGKTKHGAYMCEQAAVSAGFHMAKGEK